MMKTDKQLQHDVLAALEWEPSVNAAQIGVAAKDGIVTLTGPVASFAEKTAAERVVKRVYGVSGIANDIDVKIPGISQRSDADIAAAALNMLNWDAAIPYDHIKVSVRNGWLTLEGHVDWQYQSESAHRDVRSLIGVQGVTNSISVKAHIMPSDVKHKIEEAFKRSAEIDSRRVGVNVHDGKITLHGNVRSWTEREEAQRAAWSAPGATQVVNNLTVTP